MADVSRPEELFELGEPSLEARVEELEARLAGITYFVEELLHTNADVLGVEVPEGPDFDEVLIVSFGDTLGRLWRRTQIARKNDRATEGASHSERISRLGAISKAFDFVFASLEKLGIEPPRELDDALYLLFDPAIQ